MNQPDFTTSFTVDQTPDEVFAAIVDVRGWWDGEIIGSAEALGDEFTYRFGDLHRSTQRVTEMIPGVRVVWRVLDASLNFVEDRTEWTGTEITFELVQLGNGTEIRFTHKGLVPEFECFEACSRAWAGYVNDSLRKLIIVTQEQSDRAAIRAGVPADV